MGNVQMEASMIRYGSGTVKSALDNGGGGSGALDARVTALETTVGDETGGLVKDVSDLETTVGDNTGGLVKDVEDLKTSVENGLVYGSTATKIGKVGTDDLYTKILPVAAFPANNTNIFIDTGETDFKVFRLTAIMSSTDDDNSLPNQTVSMWLQTTGVNANKVGLYATQNYSARSGFIIFEFTKTPSNNE